MMCILAPTILANGLVIGIGQDDHWTTFNGTLINAFFEFTLSYICVFFKQKKKYEIKRKLRDPHSIYISDQMIPIDISNEQKLKCKF
jgi:hypothetical protein